MLPGHNRIDHVRSTVQFGTHFGTRSSEVIRLPEEVGVQFTPELFVGDAWRTSLRTAHMVRITDLHTPPDSPQHLQYCNFIIRMLFYEVN